MDTRLVIGGVLFVLALVAYFGGVRTGAGWGVALLVLCVLGLVGIVAQRFVTGRGAVAGGMGSKDEKVRMQQMATLIGEGLKDHVGPGSRILFCIPVAATMDYWILVMEQEWKKGLSTGLGDTSWETAGYCGIAPGLSRGTITADDLRQALAQTDAVDAIVSFAGLPKELHQMSIFQAADRPKVGAYFDVDVDLALIGNWLEMDIVQAAVVMQDGRMPLYTKDRLP